MSPVQLNVRFEAGAAPANDNFADAIAASQLPYADTIGTFGATGEAGEPDLCIGQFPIIGSTVWYRVEVTELSAVTVTTQGSDFDTVLGVYTGSTVGALTRVVCNDDANQQVLTSEVQFSAASGTTYWIQAGGFSGDTGALTLTVTRQSLGYYHAVAPYRILDTRSGPPGKVGADAEITVDVTGTGGASGVPATDVSAVVINTTVTEPTASSYLTVYPSLESRPFTSNLNFVAGQTVGNLVTVKVGTDGNVAVYNVAGETHVIFDVVGWYGAEAGGSLFNGLTPKRILDTRNGTGVPAAAKVGADTSITVDVTDPLGFGVPADATAVVVNATVAEATDASYLTVHASDALTRPPTSNLNFAAGQTVANLVTVKVGADGNVKVYNAAGQTHVIFDVVGWYGGTGHLFHPLSPVRILDTRSSPQGSPPGRVGPNAEISADVTTGSVPGTATGVIVNTTVTEPTAQSYLTVHSEVTTPLASNLNFLAGQTIANLVIVEVGANGNVKVYNAAGQVHVIFDAVGYFGP